MSFISMINRFGKNHYLTFNHSKSYFGISAMGIYCFKGTSLTPSKNDVVDCSKVGLQREELYCRNVSEYQLELGQRRLIKVNRTCVASTW